MAGTGSAKGRIYVHLENALEDLSQAAWCLFWGCVLKSQ